MPDSLATTMSRVPPLLSATSDTPVIDLTKPSEPVVETTAEPAKVDNQAERGDKSATEGDKPAGETGDKPSKEDLTPPAVKREITIERNRRRAAEERATALEADLRKALDALPKAPEPKAIEAEPRPTRDTFTDPDAYDTALIEWSGRMATKTAKAEAERESAEKANKSQIEAIQNTWADRKAAFVESHPDYDDVAESDSVQISIPMAHAIMQDEDGPAIAYYLGQHPEEAERIAKMAPVQAVATLGRVAAKLGDKPAPKAKPEPIKPVGARSNAAAKDANDESADEYVARRTTEMQAARRPFMQSNTR